MPKKFVSFFAKRLHYLKLATKLQAAWDSCANNPPQVAAPLAEGFFMRWAGWLAAGLAPAMHSALGQTRRLTVRPKKLVLYFQRPKRLFCRCWLGKRRICDMVEGLHTRAWGLPPRL